MIDAIRKMIESSNDFGMLNSISKGDGSIVLDIKGNDEQHMRLYDAIRERFGNCMSCEEEIENENGWSRIIHTYVFF